MGQCGTSVAAIRVAASGSYAYLAADGLEVVDVSDPANPHKVGGYMPSRLPLEVAVAVGHAYLLLPDGIEAIDVGSPEEPRHAGGYEADLGLGGLVVADDHLYVTTWNTGLRILDVSNPADLHLVGAYEELPTRTSEVAVQGRHACIAAGGAGLWVLDVSDPANPLHVGSIEAMHDAYTVAVSGQHAYVGDGYSLQVIDLNDPANPQRAGGCPIEAFANDVEVSGDFAYVAAQDAGLLVIDVSDPTNPHKVAGNSSFNAFGVAVDGDKVYVAATEDGLMIFDAFPLPRVSARMSQAPGERLTLTVSGRSGTQVRLQRSSDLHDWEDFHEVTLGDEPAEVEDTGADEASHGFYRAVKE